MRSGGVPHPGGGFPTGLCLFLPVSASGHGGHTELYLEVKAAPPWLPLHSKEPAGGSQAQPCRLQLCSSSAPAEELGLLLALTQPSLLSAEGLPGPAGRFLVNYLCFPVVEITTELPSLNRFVIDPDGITVPGAPWGYWIHRLQHGTLPLPAELFPVLCPSSFLCPRTSFEPLLCQPAVSLVENLPLTI